MKTNNQIRPMHNIEKATLHLPCEWYEYPKIAITTIFDVHNYGRALPRGLLVYGGEIWIASRNGDHWSMEAKIKDVIAYQRGSKFLTWRNYLRRIVRWPWEEEDTQEILESK